MAQTLARPDPARTNRLILIGAIVLAALAAVLVFVALSRSSGGSSTTTTSIAGTVDVVTASRNISGGAKITDDMLKIVTVPKNLVIEGASTDPSTLKGLTTRYPLAKGEQFSAIKLGQADAVKVFAGVIPPGKRAVAVPVTETTSVGGLIVAGDHVDITAVINGRTGGNGDQATTLLQDIEVLSVAQTAQKATTRLDANGTPIADDSISTRPGDTSAQPTARSITVAVNPQDVSIIALAQEQGKIYLSLRPTGDEPVVPGLDAPRALPTP
jgi:pilus assembly protein CpaB